MVIKKICTFSTGHWMTGEGERGEFVVYKEIPDGTDDVVWCDGFWDGMHISNGAYRTIRCADDAKAEAESRGWKVAS